MLDNKKTPGVAFYGKVRYATLGHKKAIDTAKDITSKVGGKLHIGLSGTSEPLTASQKKQHAEAMFQHPVESGSDNTKNLFSYLSHLNQHHDEVHLVAGSDRAPEYRRTLQQWNGRADKSGKVLFNFKKWKVHEVAGKREDSGKHPTKMSRDELERSASATKVIGLANSGDYEGFKAYHPDVPEKHVKRVYDQIRKGSQIREQLEIGELNHEKFGPMLDTFTQFASKKLGIKEMPVMQLSKEDLGKSFGGYSPATKSIMIVTKNRHPMDIFRTVAHELVHHKQNEDGNLGKDIAKEGATGSPHENEANAEAGKIMRWFAKNNPELFKSGFVIESYLDEGLQDPARKKAVFLAGGPGSGKDFILSRTLQGHGLREINSDTAFEAIMKKRGLSLKMPASERTQKDVARGVAKAATKKKQDLSVGGGQGLIINGTADDPAKIAAIKKHLEDNGYDTSMVFVNTRNEVSRARNQGRERSVPEDIRQEKWDAVQKAKGLLQDIFGNDKFHHVDNSDDYRTVSADRRKEIDKEHLGIFKKIRAFTTAPTESKESIEKEMQKRGIKKFTPARATKTSQKQSKPAPYQPNASEQEQAKRLGIQHKGSGQFGGTDVTHVSRNGQLTAISEDLRTWFKQKWVRFDTKGNIKGDCAREPGEGKPKCRPLASAVAMGKEARAKSARRKRREDPVADRSGKGNKPVNVRTESIDHMFEQMLTEKNVPTNPQLWARAKSLARSKFDVYPSAYANGWASKWYKSKGGGWKTAANESVNTPSAREWGTDSLTRIYKEATPGQSTNTYPLSEKKKLKKKLKQEDTTPALGYEFGNNGIGPTFGVVRSPNGLGTGYSMPMTSMAESVQKWASKESTIERFTKRYGDLAEQKIYETAVRLNEMNIQPKSFTTMREAWEALGGRDMGTVAKQGKEEVDESSPAWQRKEGKNPEGGLNRKGIASYRRENPGSKLSLAVTTKPSKLKKGSKAANRRKSFCARMSGMKKRLTSAKTANDPNSRINKSLRKWNCEE